MAAATIAGPDDNGAWRTTTREPAPESLPNTLTSSQGEVIGAVHSLLFKLHSFPVSLSG